MRPRGGSEKRIKMGPAGLSGCKCKYAYQGAANHQTYARLDPNFCAAVAFAKQWAGGQPMIMTQS
eukprot:524462-Lingulodinium_polyedra.AAC.1